MNVVRFAVCNLNYYDFLVKTRESKLLNDQNKLIVGIVLSLFSLITASYLLHRRWLASKSVATGDVERSSLSSRLGPIVDKETLSCQQREGENEPDASVFSLKSNSFSALEKKGSLKKGLSTDSFECFPSLQELEGFRRGGSFFDTSTRAILKKKESIQEPFTPVVNFPPFSLTLTALEEDNRGQVCRFDKDPFSIDDSLPKEEEAVVSVANEFLLDATPSVLHAFSTDSLDPLALSLSSDQEAVNRAINLVKVFEKIAELVPQAKTFLEGVREEEIVSQATAIGKWMRDNSDCLALVKYLNLMNLDLTELPKEIGMLTRLNWLLLSGNQLTTLPVEMGQLVELEKMTLSGNRLTTLPVEMGNLKKLQELDLTDNELIALPLEIVQLPQLAWLELAGNEKLVDKDLIHRLREIQQPTPDHTSNNPAPLPVARPPGDINKPKEGKSSKGVIKKLKKIFAVKQ